jgi:hypothetical protein
VAAIPELKLRARSVVIARVGKLLQVEPRHDVVPTPHPLLPGHTAHGTRGGIGHRGTADLTRPTRKSHATATRQGKPQRVAAAAYDGG